MTRYAPLFIALLLFAAPAEAAPITTNLSGNCVDSLPATGATTASTSSSPNSDGTPTAAASRTAG